MHRRGRRHASDVPSRYDMAVRFSFSGACEGGDYQARQVERDYHSTHHVPYKLVALAINGGR